MAKSNISHGAASQAPHYQPLAPQYLNRIDQTGRRILEQVGIRITDASFLRRLEAAGVQVDYATGRARFEPDWLDKALARAPSSFTLHSRDGRNDLTLGQGNVYFGNGGRVFRILDMATGGYRLSLLRDVAHTAALVDKLDYIRFYIIACQAHDIKPVNYHLLDFFNAFNHTTKHVMGGCDDLHGLQQMYRVASIIAGGEGRLQEKPFVSVITNPISPLTIDSGTLDILDFCVNHGIPVTCSPAPMAGATSPGTLAGTLAQTHAEALAGIAIAQAFAPGAKVLYGTFATSMDFRDMELATGSVETGMMNAAAAQLAALYDLPMYGSGGLTEAKRPDVQAGFEKAVSSLTVAMTGADLIHLAAGMLDSGNSVSYEQYVIDNEIIGMIQRLLRGITVDEDTLGFDVVEQVGPGGNFVAEDHTVDHMLTEFFYPHLRVRCNFDRWEEAGRPDMLSRANELARKILRKGEEGLLDMDVIDEIKAAFPDSHYI